mgnify:CR=1 FL=1
MTTQGEQNSQMAQINNVINNYCAEKIADIEYSIRIAKEYELNLTILKCYYMDPDGSDNIAERIRSSKCHVDEPLIEYNLFLTAIEPVITHFQSRGYTVELIKLISQCDLIVRWAN